MTNKLIFKMVYCALFIALTYAATFININLGVVGMLHLGVFVAILASLLFGGVVGGIAGSVGMGLYDITRGYPITTYLRTFIVKFIVCFVIGLIFDLLMKKDKKYRFIELVLAIVFATIGIASLLLYILKPDFITQQNIKTILLLIAAILSLVFSILFVVLFMIYHRFDQRENNVIIAASIGIIVNIILEFILRAILMSLLDEKYTFNQAISLSAIKLPASVINGFLTLVLVVGLYYPIYKATKPLIKR